MKLLRGEEGRSLPFALVVVAVGALLVVPFLAHVSTSLLGSRAMQEGMNKQYSSDAGVEFGIWKLVNDPAFRAGVDAAPGTPVRILPDILVNQVTTSITVTLTGEWSTLTDALANVGAGGALAYAGGDYIYALGGNNSRNFWRYSISGNNWTTWPLIARPPNNVGAGGALAYTGPNYPDFTYALRGNNQTTFWRYSILWNTWTTTPSPPSTPARVGAGGALVYTGGDYIYALRGNTQTTFWRYSISGNSWTPMTATPATVAAGGALVYTGGNYIYALRGSTQTTFWRYSISDNSWTSLPNAPDTIGDGGALAYDGAHIYAFRGNSRSFWRFSLGPSTYDIVATADGVTISARVVISGTDVTIQAWEIE